MGLKWHKKQEQKKDDGYTRTFLEKVTTIHGTNQFQLKSGKSRALWWMAMFVTIVITAVFIVIVQEKLRNDQIYTKEKTQPNTKEIDMFLEDLPKLKFNITPKVGNTTEIMNILKKYYYTMDTIMEEVLQKCESLLLYCEFNRKVKKCTDIFTLIKTVEGHCCAFNYAALNDVSELSLLPHDDTLEYYDGDEESDHVSGTIIATSESGRSSGLTVVFNVEPDDYPSWSKAHNYGASIVINDPNDFPETSARDTFVIIGSTVDIKVEPRVYQSEAAVRRASPMHRACWFHDEVVLEHTDRYSYETCVTECVMANYIKECGCTPYKYPRDESRRFCELADLPCTYNLTVYGRRIPCDPPCYVECRDKRYAISKNTLPFRASDYPQFDTEGHNLDHLASLKVYFIKSSCSCYKLALLMDINYFIATYGGVLGLSFGASLLTVAELLYLLVSTVYEKLSWVKKNKLSPKNSKKGSFKHK